jgi:hypothetical protein
MDAKTCCHCSRPAAFSLGVLLSTVGVSKRAQKCSPTIRLCPSCIHDLIATLGTIPLTQLQEPLRIAYTAIACTTTTSAEAQNCTAHAEEHHQGDDADASSRPCLTAGNLRHGDEVGESE